MAIRSLRHLIAFLFSLLVTLQFALPASGAVVVQYPVPVVLPHGYLQYTLHAVGTSGEIIDYFGNLNVEPMPGSAGVHNVQFPNFTTPTKADHNPPLWDDSWSAYDTYFLYGGAGEVEIDLGPPFSESNDDSTTGTLGLPKALGFTPISGFGNYTSTPESAKLLTPALAGSDVPFMQVVMKFDDLARFTGLIQEVDGSGGIPGLPQELIIGLVPLASPDVGDLDLGAFTPGQLVTGALPFEEHSGLDPVTWLLDLFSGQNATVDPTTGQFSWDSTGAPLGAYEAYIRGTNAGGFYDWGRLSFTLVPEPASFLLVILAMLVAPGARWHRDSR